MCSVRSHMAHGRRQRMVKPEGDERGVDALDALFCTYLHPTKKRVPTESAETLCISGGADGTRTLAPWRDRPIFCVFHLILRTFKSRQSRQIIFGNFLFSSSSQSVSIRLPPEA